jgi:hypothetical protein
MFNPLLDIIFTELSSGKVFKIHTLATMLTQRGNLPPLDDEPNKSLFKRNFLVMNALFQLQAELLESKQYLHIDSMSIYLTDKLDKSLMLNSPLKDYYLDWGNYDTSTAEIERLLTQFWQTFHATNKVNRISKTQLQALCQAWQLPYPFSQKQLSKKWRQHALAFHPDKNPAGSEVFKRLYDEYMKLKLAASD